MIPQVEHKIFSSFKEWFEHNLLQDLQAYKNYTSPLYPMVDNRLNQTTYSAPFYQWVFDQSVSGASIPTAASLNVPYVDYNNGRTIGGAPTGSVTYAIKDFNIYTTTKSDARLLLEEKYDVRPDPRSNPPVSGMPPYDILAPCIFIKPEAMNTKPFTLGGGIQEKLIYSVVLISDDEFKNVGVGAYFNKKRHSIFICFDETPLNYYGDYKTGGYNYKDKARSLNQAGRYIYIDDVQYTPIEIDSLAKENPNLFYAKMIFTCHYYTDANLRIF